MFINQKWLKSQMILRIKGSKMTRSVIDVIVDPGCALVKTLELI